MPSGFTSCRLQGQRGQSHEPSSLSQTLRSWVQIPLEAQKSVCASIRCSVYMVLCARIFSPVSAWGTLGCFVCFLNPIYSALCPDIRPHCPTWQRIYGRDIQTKWYTWRWPVGPKHLVHLNINIKEEEETPTSTWRRWMKHTRSQFWVLQQDAAIKYSFMQNFVANNAKCLLKEAIYFTQVKCN